MADVVADASALVDLLLANDLGREVGRRLAGCAMHAPAHIDAEVLSALGRLHRAGDLDAGAVESKLAAMAAAPIIRHTVDALLSGAWGRRHSVWLADALYLQLAAQLDCALVTTDRRLGDQPLADVVTH